MLMRHILAFFAALLVGLPSVGDAATFYLNGNCMTSRAFQPAAGCVPGSNSNDGLTPSTPKETYQGFSAAQRVPGNRFCWARGGVQDVAVINLYAANSSKGNSITFCSYIPSWLTVPTSTVTITAGAGSSAFVINWTGHGLAAGAPVEFSTTGSLPYGIDAGRTYFVQAAGLTANSFQIGKFRSGRPSVMVPATTEQGTTAVSTAQSGTHTALSAPLPVLYQCTIGQNLFNVDDAQPAAPFIDGGYRWENLHIEGCAYPNGGSEEGRGGQSAFYLANLVNDVEWENIECGGFNTCVFSNHSPHSIRGTKAVHKGLRFTKGYVHDMRGSAILGGAEYLDWSNNAHERNGQGTDGKQHDIYISSAAHGTIAFNDIFSPAPNTMADPRCDGSAIVAHGVLYGLRIVRNRIVADLGSKGSCYGIEADPAYLEWNSPAFNEYRYNGEELYDILISQNYLENLGGAGISIGGCRRCVVENNIMKWLNDTGAGYSCFTGGHQPVGKDRKGGQNTFRHNFCYMNSSAAVAPNPACYRAPTREGTGHQVNGNVCVFGPAVTATQATCWVLGSTTQSDYALFDGNGCWALGGTAKHSDLSSTFAGRPAWLEPNGKFENPNIVTVPTVTGELLPGSTFINAAIDAYCPRTAWGNYRREQCDIGPEESGKTVRLPYPPATVRH